MTPILLARPRLVAPPPTYLLPVGRWVELDFAGRDARGHEAFAFAAGTEWWSNDPAVVKVNPLDESNLSVVATALAPGVATVSVEAFRAGDLLSLVARLTIDTRPPAVPVEIRAGLPLRIRRAP